MMKGVIAILLVLCMLIAPVCISAESANFEIMPRWTNVINFSVNFNISTTGLATALASYIADDNRLQSIRVETRIQKKILLFFWIDIDGGTWTDNFATSTGNFKHTMQLEDKATYRAVFHVYAVGSDGSVDDFELTKEYVYE